MIEILTWFSLVFPVYSKLSRRQPLLFRLPGMHQVRHNQAGFT
jgi:hypothetical protein